MNNAQNRPLWLRTGVWVWNDGEKKAGKVTDFVSPLANRHGLEMCLVKTDKGDVSCWETWNFDPLAQRKPKMFKELTK